MKPNSKEKFWANVSISQGCWQWLGYKNPQGYGRFSFNDKFERAHRLAYMFEKGKIPKGKLVCHHCDNPSCVNPEHLYVGDAQDNSNDRTKRERISGKSSKYIGVVWVKARKRWYSTLRIKEKTVWIGCFLNERKCAISYDEYVIKNKLNKTLNGLTQPPETEATE